MKVQGISVGVAQTSRGYGKAGFAKSGPQIERPAHRRRERPDLIRGPPHRRRERAIGLHPASSENPGGRKGSMAIGLQLKGSIRDAVSALKAKGVRFQGEVVNEGKAGSFIGFEDPDGNQLYLAELNWSHVEKGEGQYQPAKA